MYERKPSDQLNALRRLPYGWRLATHEEKKTMFSKYRCVACDRTFWLAWTLHRHQSPCIQRKLLHARVREQMARAHAAAVRQQRAYDRAMAAPLKRPAIRQEGSHGNG